MSCSRIQCSDAGEARTRGPSVSSQAFYHLVPTCQCNSLVSQLKKPLIPTCFGIDLALCILGNISRLIWMKVRVFCKLSIFFSFCKFLRKSITVPGDKNSARIYEWILERTSDSSQSPGPTGQELNSARETSIF